MEISPKFAQPVYKTSQKIYNGKISRTQEINYLFSEHGLNKSSMGDLIQNFKCMIEGKRFTRTMNAYYTDFFLKNFLLDYGQKGLLDGLNALKRHIDYYEPLRKVNLKSLRRIYNEYSNNVSFSTIDQIEQDELIKLISSRHPSKKELIIELQQNVGEEPEVIMINHKAFKRDNKTVALLKTLHDFKCQMCGSSILKSNGEKYVEAAHIIPKHKKGKEILKNILILCPNHHKEFDLGKREKLIISDENVKFLLNGKQFDLRFLPVFN